MAKARRREAWDHTSLLCAVVHNAGFGAKKAKRPADFNPTREVVRLSPKESVAYLASLGKSLGTKKKR